MENTWRALSAQEIEQLEKQLNSADDWNLVSVVDAFKADGIHRTHFGGRVFIGADVRIANVGLLAGYRLEEGCRLQNVGELSKGRIKLAPGTLYGALNSLVDKGWIDALPENPESRKKEYVITTSGKAVLKEEIERLAELVDNGKKFMEEA